MKSKEEWINDVIESSAGLETVAHQPFLYRKTLNALENPPSQKSNWAIPALATMAILIFLNSFMVFNYQEQNTVAFFEDTDIDLIIEGYALDEEEEVSLYNF